MKIYKSTRARAIFDKLGYTYISCKKQDNGNFAYICEKDETTHCFELSFTDTAIIVFKHEIGNVQFVATECVDSNSVIIRG